MAQALSVANLSVSYHDEAVLQNVSVDIGVGRLVGIIGPNGAGKTTLIKAVLGLVPVDRGAVTVFGDAVDRQRKWIGYMPQRALIDWDFPINVLETVLLGTYPHLGLLRRPGPKQRAWAYECLAQVGMADYASRQIGQLSGGQQQRVFVARALAQRARLLFLDEPFVGVDAHSEQLIVDTLRRLRDEGKTVLIVHHDLTKVHEYYDDVLLLNKALIAYGPVADVFNVHTLGRTYEGKLPLLPVGEGGMGLSPLSSGEGPQTSSWIPLGEGA